MTLRVPRDTLERFIRGGLGSSLVHGALLGVLLAPLPVATPRSVSNPSVTRLTPARVSAATLRNQDRPFRDEPQSRRQSELSLSITDDRNGADLRIDLARIRDRRDDLFPFVTWNLDFFRERPGDDEGDGGLQFNLGVEAIPPAGGPPLRMSPEEIQEVVDRAWSRRHRWSNLQELIELSERYNPDAGDLPTVVHEYLRQNVPQPYEDWTDPDPVYWITLMLAADDAPIVEFVARYARRHPASRTTTELLFLLDASAETSCDVLGRVLRAGSLDLPLRLTRADNPDAYDLAMSLASAYRGWVIRQGVALPDRCNVGRINLLRRIIDTSPDQYGVADARFRLGQLLWLADRQTEAVEWWAGMQPDERSQYAQAQRALLGAIADGAAEYNPSRISGILRDAERRWQIQAAERLAHFGVKATEF